MTKKIGNLFEQVLSLDNLRLAFNKAAKGKRHQRRVRRIENNLDYYLKEIQRMLREHTFTTSPYHTKIIYEPKVRIIYVLPFYPDRIVQHAYTFNFCKYTRLCELEQMVEGYETV